MMKVTTLCSIIYCYPFIQIVLLHLVRNVPRLPNMEEASSTATTVTITWSFTSVLETRNETFTVLYGTSLGQLGLTSPPVSSVPNMNQYSIQLTSLQPGTTYYYQIQSENNFRNLTTLLNTARTMDSSKYLSWIVTSHCMSFFRIFASQKCHSNIS